MSIHSVRTFVPAARNRSSAILDEARAMTRSTLERIARRNQSSQPEAMQTLARSAGVSPGSLENLLRDRLKTISAADYSAIREACVAEITREIGPLERELRRARTAGPSDRPRPADIRAAEAAVEAARRMIAALHPNDLDK